MRKRHVKFERLGGLVNYESIRGWGAQMRTPLISSGIEIDSRIEIEKFRLLITFTNVTAQGVRGFSWRSANYLIPFS